ncbi:DNA-directed DNA polymerase [Synchytrium endobioticum]|uniref:DNA-directed DNA polymerase n=1 Tax=Synchytrium endobioticum TaxID=286115 RepID=A0A507D1X2_9FUNG|nr:DNA-directed DNA polymerase [Synchytrium endobioticum]
MVNVRMIQGTNGSQSTAMMAVKPAKRSTYLGVYYIYHFYTCTVPQILGTTWLVDSGALLHTVNESNKLSNLKGSKPVVKGIGNSTLTGTQKGRFTGNVNGIQVVLEDVLVVPGLEKNPISEGQLFDEGYQVYNTKEGDKLLVSNEGKIPISGTETLYPLNIEQETSTTGYKASLVDSELWHARMGHPSAARMKRVILASVKYVHNAPEVTSEGINRFAENKGFNEEVLYRTFIHRKVLSRDTTGQYKNELEYYSSLLNYIVHVQLTFAPTSHLSSLRILVSLIAVSNWSSFHISTAFVNGELEEEGYVKQPAGYEDGTNRMLHVDDFLLTSPTKETVELVEKLLEGTFEHIQAQERNGYVSEILDTFNMQACNHIKYPMVTGFDTHVDSTPTDKQRYAMAERMYLKQADDCSELRIK